jgi:maleate isomerase
MMKSVREPRGGNLRARIGIVIPSSCRRVEQDLIPALPKGVVGHVARLRMTGPHHAPLPELLPRLAEAAANLADADCDIIVFNCTSSSMSEGSEGERQVVAAMQQASGRPITTAGAAVRRAMLALSSRKVALATPYSEASTARVANFIRAAGMDVSEARALSFPTSDQSCGAPSSFWMEIVQGLAATDADTIFLSCANTDTFGIIEEIERRFDRRVVTTNQAVLWDSVRRLGMNETIAGIGRLGAAAAPAEAQAA